MVVPHILLHQAKSIGVELLGNLLQKIELNTTLSQLKITLTTGVITYIKYNEFGEYGYQIIHSPRKKDFSRFDNFDDKWEVKTRPHHFHERNSKTVLQSPMIGEHSKDIPILVEYLIKGAMD